MSLAIPSDQRKYDLVAIGGWAVFDHIFRIDHYPQPGETVEITDPDGVDKQYWGDCVFNVAAVAGKLGLSVGVASVVGSDFTASGYTKWLSDLGVDTSSGLRVQPDLACGHNFLFSDPNGDTVCYSWRGASLRQSECIPDHEVVEQARLVVLNEAFDQFTLAGARMAAEFGAFVVCNGMLGTAELPLLREYLRHINLLCISKAEAQMLLQRLETNSIEGILDFGPQAIIITQGSDGSQILFDGRQVAIPAVQADKVEDVTGAGDSFVAGVCAGLLKGMEISEAARLGAAVASFVIEKVGCQTNLPSWDEAYTRAFDRRAERRLQDGSN